VPFGQRFVGPQRGTAQRDAAQQGVRQQQGVAQLHAAHSQRTIFNADGSFGVANPSANCLDWCLRGLRALIFYPVSISSQTLPPLPCLVQEGEDIVCLGRTSKAYTVAHVVGGSDGSFVNENAVNTACRCPTPHQPLFHRN
jgi:hypothetical protein